MLSYRWRSYSSCSLLLLLLLFRRGSSTLNPFLHVVTTCHPSSDAPSSSAQQLLEGVPEFRREYRVDCRVQGRIEIPVKNKSKRSRVKKCNQRKPRHTRAFPCARRNSLFIYFIFFEILGSYVLAALSTDIVADGTRNRANLTLTDFHVAPSKRNR